MSNRFEQALKKIQEDYDKGIYTGYLNPKEYEDELRSELGHLVGKPIYRAVRLNHENMLDRKNIGIYWTWDKDRAVTYWGHEGDMVVSLEAKATEDNIDWEATIEQWMKPQYNGECEVRLKPKSNIDVSNIWVNKIKKPKSFRAVANNMNLKAIFRHNSVCLYDEAVLVDPKDENYLVYLAESIVGVCDLRYNQSHQAYEIESIAANRGYGMRLIEVLAAAIYPEKFITDRTNRITAAANKLFTKMVHNPNLEVSDIEDDGPFEFSGKKFRAKDKSAFASIKSTLKGELETDIVEEADAFLRHRMSEIYGSIRVTSMNDELQRFIDESGGLYYSFEYLMSSKADERWEEQKEFNESEGEDQSREEWAKSEEDFHLFSGDPSMCFDKAQKLNPNEWLIHFTNSNPIEIIKSGFKGRSVDVIGLTTYYKAGTNQGDLALAFAINDVKPERSSEFGKYGKNAVLFKAKESARAYHWGDEEYQVVFVANTAHSMHPIFGDSSQLTLTDLNGEDILVVDRNNAGLGDIVIQVQKRKTKTR